MVLRGKTMSKVGPDSDEPAPEQFSQRRKPDIGQFLLQVDRQTKRSYASLDAAEEAGAAIKIAHKIVQVSIYDAIDCTNTLIGDDGKPVAAPAKAE